MELKDAVNQALGKTDQQISSPQKKESMMDGKPCAICGTLMPFRCDMETGETFCRCLKPECNAEKKRRREEKIKQDRERNAENEFPPMYRGAKLSDCGFEKEILAWLESPLPGLLTFSGTAGNGKTRMMYAVIAHLRRQGKYPEDWRVAFLLKRLQVMCGQDAAEEEKEVKRLCHAEQVLCLDDLGTEKVTEFTLQDFYLILAEREQWQLPTLITTNLTLEQISESLGDRIASRIAGGIVLKFSGKDKRVERTH